MKTKPSETRRVLRKTWELTDDVRIKSQIQGMTYLHSCKRVNFHEAADVTITVDFDKLFAVLGVKALASTRGISVEAGGAIVARVTSPRERSNVNVEIIPLPAGAEIVKA